MIARCLFVFAVLLSAFSADAYAQIIPSGQFTPGHTVSCANSTCTVITDGGGAAGSFLPGQGYLTELGITATGTPFCINDALTSAAGGYHQLCLASNAMIDGDIGGFITYNAYGGASALPLFVNLNGTNYEFPFSGGGGLVPIAPGTLLGNATGASNLPVAIPFADVPGMIPALGSPNVSGSAASTTGTVTGSNTMTLAAKQDFVTGQGVRINAVGPNASLGTPVSCAVTQNGTGGVTNYQYHVAAFDSSGGVTASVTCSTTTGNATLSLTNNNLITVTGGSGSPAGYVVYGNTSGSQVYYNIFPGTTYQDRGLGPGTPPDWVPPAPPSSAVPDWVVSIIQAGGGTTGITIAGTFTNSTPNAAVYHDDTVALQTAINSLKGAAFFWNNGTYRISSALSITSPICMFGAGRNYAQIVLSSPTQDGLDIATNDRNCLYDFAIAGNDSSGTSNTAGFLINSSQAHFADTWAHLGFTNAFDAIKTVNLQTFDFDDLQVVCDDACFRMTSPSDSTIHASTINPVTLQGATAATAFVFDGDPAIRLINNKVNSGQYDTVANIDIGISDGDFIVVGGSYEGYLNHGFVFGNTGPSITYGAIIFSGVEFNGGIDDSIVVNTALSRQWIRNLNINGSVFGSGGVGTAITVDSVAHLMIGDVNIANAVNGIVVGANSTACTLGHITYDSVTTPLQDDSGTCSGTALRGTGTNDSGVAGNLGEFMSNTETGVSLTSNTNAAICSLTLTPGDWDVRGEVSFVPAGSTVVTGFGVGSSTTSGLAPGHPDSGTQVLQGISETGMVEALNSGSKRYSLASTTPVYLNAFATFSVSTLTAECSMESRRMR